MLMPGLNMTKIAWTANSVRQWALCEGVDHAFAGGLHAV